jgi:hypothetical protein
VSIDPVPEKLRIVTRELVEVKEPKRGNGSKIIILPLTLTIRVSMMRPPEIRAWRERQNK